MLVNMRPLGLDFGDSLDAGVPSDFNNELENEAVGIADEISPFDWMTDPFQHHE